MEITKRRGRNQGVWREPEGVEETQRHGGDPGACLEPSMSHENENPYGTAGATPSLKSRAYSKLSLLKLYMHGCILTCKEVNWVSHIGFERY